MATLQYIGKFLLGIVLGALVALTAEILLIEIWDFIVIQFGITWFSSNFGVQSFINLCVILCTGVYGYRTLKHRDVLFAEGFISGCIISILVLIYIIFIFYKFFLFDNFA